jgi:hypothetical protein
MRAVCLCLCLTGTVLAAPPDSVRLHHESNTVSPALPLPEMPEGVTGFVVRGTLADKGKLFLDLRHSTPAYTEAGEPARGGKPKSAEIECVAAFVKELEIKRRGGTIKRNLYRLEGKGLKSKLFLLGPEKEGGTPRLLVHDGGGKVVHVVEFRDPPKGGCHPGCFPAGTPVATPKGVCAVETIRVGDEVTAVDAKGRAAVARVKAVFTESNTLMLVETDAGTLVTTPSQPLSCADGAIVAARDLLPGDEIHRWKDGKRVTARVRSISDSGRTAKVFNVVLGNSEVFIAGGFLARSKPASE